MIETGTPRHPMTNLDEARYVADRLTFGPFMAAWLRLVRELKTAVRDDMDRVARLFR